MSMTIDEVLGVFQAFLNNERLQFLLGFNRITPAVNDAIPILRKAKEMEGVAEWPTCPQCGKEMYQPGHDYAPEEGWYCIKCPSIEDVECDVFYRVKEKS